MSLKNKNTVNPDRPKRVAIILSNPSVSTTGGWPVGFWWSELSHPYLVLSEKGFEIEVFSPNGGKCEADATSDPREASGFATSDLISMGFVHSPHLTKLVETPERFPRSTSRSSTPFWWPAAQGPMFTFDKAFDLHQKFVEFYEAGKLACAVCHGVSILRYAKLSNGEYLAKGKTVTGFANIEEDFVDEQLWSTNVLPRGQHLMPWRIEDELKRIGANFIQAGLWKGFAVRDGNLVTGQQSQSGMETPKCSLLPSAPEKRYGVQYLVKFLFAGRNPHTVLNLVQPESKPIDDEA